MIVEGLHPVDEAASWHVRAATMDADDWALFADWLATSPANAAAYEAVARIDYVLAEPLSCARQTPSRVASARFLDGRRGWVATGGLAIAATVLALVSIGQQGKSAIERIVTAPGKGRIVNLSDGTRIAMNGDTALVVDRERPRELRLEHGEAFFAVRHDAKRPFSVTTTNAKIVDLGTEFNVIASQDALRVQVRSGVVRLDHRQQSFVLTQGRAITVDEAAKKATVGNMENVGSWQHGQLFFSAEKISVIVDAIERQTGTKISYANDLSGLTFTGNVRLTGDAASDVRHLAALMGIDAQLKDQIWVLSTRR